MVCAKCSKLTSATTLATPSVKRKSELYYGSSASGSPGDPLAKLPKKTSASTPSAGISKNKLLSKSAKNPYAAYSASCEKCKVKVEQGRTYCQKCAYKENVCAVCGKKENSSKSSAPIVQGAKFSAK